MPFYRISDADYLKAATELACEVAAIRAVAEVESNGYGFLPDSRPVILFEAHVFDRLTKGKFRYAVDRNGVFLSVPSWDRSLYGRTGAHQYERLADAMKLDRRAAQMACSWGMFQIMGMHYATLGFDSIDAFVDHMDAAAGQLEVFVDFIRVNHLDDELQRRDWAGFARQYNGPAYAQNKYDEKMRAAYLRFS